MRGNPTLWAPARTYGPARRSHICHISIATVEDVSAKRDIGRDTTFRERLSARGEADVTDVTKIQSTSGSSAASSTTRLALGSVELGIGREGAAALFGVTAFGEIG
jgi:hypothetical protein